jgi:hypothetical protein
VFFCHGVFGWLIVERLKPIASDIISKSHKQIEHGKGGDRSEQVGDEFVDGVYCFHDFHIFNL